MCAVVPCSNWPRAPVMYRASRCRRHAETEVRRCRAERRAVARIDAVHWGAPGSCLARTNPANTASCHIIQYHDIQSVASLEGQGDGPPRVTPSRSEINKSDSYEQKRKVVSSSGENKQRRHRRTGDWKRSPGFSGKNRRVTPSVAAPGVTHPSDVTA